MKRILTFLFITSLLFIQSCSSRSNDSKTIIKSNESTSITNSKDEENMETLQLKINETIVNVIWEDNQSVNALKELAKYGLTINMHEYGGFEQTGMIGKTIISNDSNINVIPGDIVLYNSNQISIFYNNSRWSYTKLGHINLNNNELNNLLNVDNVVVTFTIK